MMPNQPLCTRRTLAALALPAALAVLAAAPAHAQLCAPDWSALPFDGFNGVPTSFAVFNDGSAPSLYAGGLFDQAGGTPAYIARWNGAAWLPLGAGVDNFVQTLLVWDNGSGGGPALYAGGDFTSAGGEPAAHVARWDGSAWTPLDLNSNTIYTLAAFDDGAGSGPALYAGDAAGIVWRRDGDSWTPLPALESSVYTLAAFDDGQGGGPALYAGGRFQGVYRWNGEAWQLVGAAPNGRTYVLHAFDDDGSGGAAPRLFAGGDFDQIDGNPAGRVIAWDGAAWSAVGSGVDGEVRSMTVFNDGANGPGLYVGGSFSNAGEIPTPYVARWDGQAWSSLGGGTNNIVLALVGFEADPLGPSLYAGGDFANAGSGLAGRIARWACTSVPCAADFNDDGAANSQDFFDFLTAFFALAPAADFNADNAVNSQDFFDFLIAFFAGC